MELELSTVSTLCVSIVWGPTKHNTSTRGHSRLSERPFLPEPNLHTDTDRTVQRCATVELDFCPLLNRAC